MAPSAIIIALLWPSRLSHKQTISYHSKGSEMTLSAIAPSAALAIMHPRVPGTSFNIIKLGHSGL
eukprot:scaffold168935_cov38-Prasinocladus_malaysianus.AAC.1